MLKFGIKKVQGPVLLIFSVISLFDICASEAGPEYSKLIAKGDSTLLVLNYDLARGFYQAAGNLAQSGYNKYFADYKIGYSYIVEDERFLALAYFTDIQISYEIESDKDSSLYLLNELEINLITVEILRPSYDINAVINGFQKYNAFLSDWQKARAYYLLGNVYKERRYLNESIDFYKKALNYSNHTDQWLIEHIYYGLLSIYNLNEDVQNINDIGMYLLENGTNYIDKSEVYRSIGYSKFLRGEYVQAREYLRTSLSMVQEHNDTFNIVRDYLTLGNSYILQNNFEMAGLMYDSTEYYGVNYSEETIKIGSVVPKAFYYYWIKDVDKMKKYFHKATAVIEEYQNVPYKAMLLEYIAQYYMDINEYKTAIDSLDAFFKKTDNIPKNLLINKVSWKVYIDLYRQRAESVYLLWKTGGLPMEALQESFDGYRGIMQLTEESFQRYLSNSSRQIFLKKSRDACVEAFLCGFDLYQNKKDKKTLSELLSIIEQSKANIFRANFQHNKSLQISGIPNKLIQLELELKRQEAWLRHYLDDKNRNKSKDKEVELKLRNELVHVIARHDSLIKVFEKEFPQYFNSKYGYKEIKIDDVQKHLTNEQIILDYFLTDNRLFILGIEAGAEKLLEIPIDSNFVKELSDYRGYIEAYNIDSITKKMKASFFESAYFLYTKLIEPFQEWIEGKQIIVIPDRELNLIPFETFIASKNKFNDICEDYLVFHNSVNILYSIDQIFTEQKYISKRSNFIGFAPSYPDNNLNSELLDLPGAAMELETVHNLFKGITFFGGKASKENFFKEAKFADIIHLALHTQLSDVKPLYSELFFSNQLGHSVDTMYTYEILDKQLVSKLLVLSGCNTGYGELRYGDGVINLARSFIYSGIENLIVTQWAVADKSSSVLMRSFYENLSDGNSVDVALQKAKIDFLLNQDPVNHHPYFWSGYISVGKPVKYKKGISPTFILICTILLLSFGMMLFYNRKKYK